MAYTSKVARFESADGSVRVYSDYENLGACGVYNVEVFEDGRGLVKRFGPFQELESGEWEDEREISELVGIEVVCAGIESGVL